MPIEFILTTYDIHQNNLLNIAILRILEGKNSIWLGIAGNPLNYTICSQFEKNASKSKYKVE